MRRGEVWLYKGLRERDVLIVQADAAAPNASTVMAIPLVDLGTVIETMTTIRVGRWIADATRIGEFRRASLAEQVGVIGTHELDQLGAALKMALGLD